MPEFFKRSGKMELTYNEGRAIIALAVIHWIAWSAWAKADYFRKREMWDWERLKSMFPSTMITLMSIWAINYPAPESWGVRIGIDVFAVGLVVFLRWVYFPMKYGRKSINTKIKPIKKDWKNKKAVLSTAFYLI